MEPLSVARAMLPETSTALSVASRLKTSSPRPDKLKRTARSELTAGGSRIRVGEIWTATPTGVQLFPKLKVDVNYSAGFARAREDGAFPVRYYWETPEARKRPFKSRWGALPLPGSEGLCR